MSGFDHQQGVVTEQELTAIASLWRLRQREFVTSFAGTSMLPAVAPGQRLIVACGITPIVGDVIAFQRQQLIGVHRIVGCGAEWLLTWGDANALPDEPIKRDRVIGVVRGTPAAPRSIRRLLLLRMLASRGASMEILTRRVRLAYAVKAAWAKGPAVFAAKCWRAINRFRMPCKIR